MRVLLAEDDERLGKLVRYMLEKQGMQVEWVASGDMAYEYAMYEPYDVAILDWMMPVESGVSACRRLREKGYQQAILLLTARGDLEDRVTGLETGADDYLVKPFEFAELIARVRALGRRANRTLRQDIVRLGAFSLDRTAKVLLKDEREVQLSPREFQIFDLLAQNAGAVVPREVLLDRVWGLESEVNPNSLDSYIKLLRKKVGLAGSGVAIHTVRGVGYRLEEG